VNFECESGVRAQTAIQPEGTREASLAPVFLPNTPTPRNGPTEVDLWGLPFVGKLPELKKKGQAKGWAAPPGSGPTGETCGTCAHAYANHGHRKTFWKCELVRATLGPGTDIRLKWAACHRWEAKIANSQGEAA